MKVNLYTACLIIFLITGIAACTKTDDYKKFYGGKEIVYPGKANLVEAYPGKNRITLSWLVSDPKVTSYKVYWDNRSDSILGTTGNTIGKIERTINNLTEGTHSFKIITYDKYGNASVSVDAIGTAFGDSYQAGLLNRLVRSASTYKGKATVEWYNAAAGTSLSEIKYNDVSDVERIVKVKGDEALAELPNFKEGSSFQYRTLFLPDSNAIDTFYTAYTSIKPSPVLALRISTGKVYTAVKRPAEAAKPFDGNPATFWYSTGGTFPEPLHVDLLAEYDITLFKTQFHDKTDNLYSYYIEVSNDNINWRRPVPNAPHAGVTGAYAVFEHPVTERGRYVRITFTGNTKGHWASIAEFEIWGN
jgi:hypothetical protein